MLCLEGLSIGLGVFLGNKEYPNYRTIEPPGARERIVVKPEVGRPLPRHAAGFCACIRIAAGASCLRAEQCARVCLSDGAADPLPCSPLGLLRGWVL